MQRLALNIVSAYGITTTHVQHSLAQYGHSNQNGGKLPNRRIPSKSEWLAAMTRAHNVLQSEFTK